VCAHAVRVSLKSVSGVDSVDVSLAKGLASVKMKPGNTTSLSQLQQAITKNGFTMKDSQATVVGLVEGANGKAQLKISGSNEVLSLVPEPQASSNPSSLSGRVVLVTGTIPEATKGKTPDSIRYRSIQEEQSK
jgi:copper chaperone CopZ